MRRAARSVLGAYKKKNAVIDITFISDGKIKALNKKYMKKDRATDVLSFILGEERSGLIGDIYISSDRASDNARRFGTSFRREAALYTIHGVLHLLGLGDRTAKEKNRIRKLEDKFLRGLLKTCSARIS
jgi:probable rRNA maturation factor